MTKDYGDYIHIFEGKDGKYRGYRRVTVLKYSKRLPRMSESDFTANTLKDAIRFALAFDVEYGYITSLLEKKRKK